MARPRKDRTEHHVRRRPLKRGGCAFDVTVPLSTGKASKTFYDLDAAVAWRDEQLGLYRRGEATRQTADTLGALLDRWLCDEAAPRVRASTLDSYTQTVRTHLLPRLGSTRADKLSAADVHGWLAAMERDGVGGRSRQLALLRLKQTLKWAVDVELLRRNVAEKVTPPNVTPEEGIALSHEELAAFLAAAQHDNLWPLWRVYAMTGLRRGEGLGLRWQDVGDGVLSVRQQVRVVKGKDGKARPAVQQLKSQAALRTLDIDSDTERGLTVTRDVHHHALNGHQLGGQIELVFATHVGTPLNPNNLYRNWERIIDRSGLDPALTIHDLRHSHGSQCLLAGWPIEAVSRRLGHANASITLRIYSHLVQGYSSKAAIDALAAAVRLLELGG